MLAHDKGRRSPPGEGRVWMMKGQGCQLRLRLSGAVSSGVIAPWQFEKRGRQVEVAVEGRLTVNNPELAIRAALDGVGEFYTALAYAAPEIKAGRLVPLLEDWRMRSAAIFLYYPSRRQVPVLLRTFIEFLRENL